ncbi:MAG TPA: hypothetical protein VJB87_03270 [Candidatus Nanoarchaeia archaeon]|nr:hypothetical protein [Candidatus Nanoarchaeia archaeon]
MTFLLIHQSPRRILAVSDLQLTFLPNDDPGPRTFVTEKFRPDSEGNLVAYHGRMNSDEIQILETTPLADLKKQAFSNLPNIRKNLANQILAIDITTAQAYEGDSENPLTPVRNYHTSACGITADRILALQRKITEGLPAEPSRKDLERMALQTEFFLLEEEKTNTTIGGCISYIIQPGKLRVYRRALGKLHGFPEAVWNEKRRLVY